VAAHRDAPLRDELPGGEHGEQADRAVADDLDRLAWAGFGSDGAEPTGAKHVGGRQQARDQIGDGRSEVGTRVPSGSGTRSTSACAPKEPIATRFTPCTFLVKDVRKEWVRVFLLTRPNGSQGWVRKHGTNQPGVIGSAVSNGCIRLKNHAIHKLAGKLPLGTPVHIRS
jgi:L,D-transpeptidase catalytic domain